MSVAETEFYPAVSFFYASTFSQLAIREAARKSGRENLGDISIDTRKARWR